MEPSARLFHCARCHCQVIICRRCDRGNVYCFKGCAGEARKRCLRDANARYRRSHRGRLANAARQRRYRARQQKVTYQGSDPAGDPALLKPGGEVTATTPVSTPPKHRNIALEPMCCHGCGRPVSVYLRHRFQHSGRQRARAP